MSNLIQDYFLGFSCPQRPILVSLRCLANFIQPYVFGQGVRYLQLSLGSNYRCLNCGIKINGGADIAVSYGEGVSGRRKKMIGGRTSKETTTKRPTIPTTVIWINIRRCIRAKSSRITWLAVLQI